MISSGWALIALAFSDDFETGDLSQWNSPPTINHPAVQLSVTAAGAHRGSFGFTVTDNEPGPAQSFGNYVSSDVTPPERDLYLRHWLRVRSTNQLGYVITTWMLGTTNGRVSTESGFDTYDLFIHGFEPDGGEVRVREAADYDAAQWYLIEIATTGAGTDAGHRLLWVDGLLIADNTGDFTGRPTVGLSLGQAYSWNDWQGVFDLDDFRSSTSPPVSTLSLVQVGDAGCVPLRVELRDSLGDLRPAPYPFFAALEGDGGTLHGGVDCTGAAEVFFDAGSESAAASWLPSAAGTVEVRAAYVDFLSKPAALSGAPTERVQRVACGCQAVDVPWLFLALLCWLREAPKARDRQ